MASSDAEMQEETEEGGLPSRLKGKVQILPGHPANLSACTFVLHGEDHTLGNALRYMIMKNPHVEFCGYSAPHPSEPKIHLRIQMYDQVSALDALLKGLDDLEGMFLAIAETYEQALRDPSIRRPEPTAIDWDEIRRKKEANRRAGLLPGSTPVAPQRRGWSSEV